MHPFPVFATSVSSISLEVACATSPKWTESVKPRYIIHRLDLSALLTKTLPNAKIIVSTIGSDRALSGSSAYLSMDNGKH